MMDCYTLRGGEGVIVIDQQHGGTFFKFKGAHGVFLEMGKGFPCFLQKLSTHSDTKAHPYRE